MTQRMESAATCDIFPRMNYWLLVSVTGAVLYGLWLLLHFTFTMIDRAHELRRAEPRNAGVPPLGERDGSA